jgi:mRNA interferase RelE/StbE
VPKHIVELSSKAQKFYAACPADLAQRLQQCFEELEIDPYRGANIKRLKTRPSERLFRYRIGDYRVVYEIFEREIIVLVVKIAKRDDVYKKL